MDRRNFLTSILALGAAPAIVSADNLMKIWVPPEKRITTLADWARESGAIPASVINSMEQMNDIIDDLPWMSDRKMTIRTRLPPMGWKAINQSAF